MEYNTEKQLKHLKNWKTLKLVSRSNQSNASLLARKKAENCKKTEKVKLDCNDKAHQSILKIYKNFWLKSTGPFAEPQTNHRKFSTSSTQ